MKNKLDISHFMENTVSKITSRNYTHQIQKVNNLSSNSWLLLNALKSFDSVNGILLTKSVPYQGKNMLVIYVLYLSV